MMAVLTYVHISLHFCNLFYLIFTVIQFVCFFLCVCAMSILKNKMDLSPKGAQNVIGMVD